MTPASQVLDSPIVIDQGPGLPEWRPENFTDDYLGLITLRVGLEKSRNLISVRLANETKKFEGVAMTPEQKRKMDFLKAGMVMPAPSTGTPEQQKAVADELNTIMTDLQSTYGKGKVPLDSTKFDVNAVLKIINQALADLADSQSIVSFASEIGRASCRERVSSPV